MHAHSCGRLLRRYRLLVALELPFLFCSFVILPYLSILLLSSRLIERCRAMCWKQGVGNVAECRWRWVSCWRIPGGP